MAGTIPLDPTRAAMLLMRHRTALTGYLLAGLGNHADVEDVLQEVAVAVVRDFGQLRDAAEFLPWSREIARRRMLALARSRRRTTALDGAALEALDAATARVEVERSTEGLAAHLEACLGRLPGEARDFLRARYGGDEATEALAARFRRSVQGIYAWAKRLKAELRGCVERRMARGEGA